MTQPANVEDFVLSMFSYGESVDRQAAQDMQDAMLPRIFDYVDSHADETPNKTAFIEYKTGEECSWADFRKKSVAFAAQLLTYGVEKGDVICTSIPLLKEHVFLLVACLRLGAIFVPLDLRLKSAEINRCFEMIRPKLYFHLGETPVIDFRPIVSDVIAHHSVSAGGSVEAFVQFQKGEEGIIPGSMSVMSFVKRIKLNYLLNCAKECLGYGVKGAQMEVTADDTCFLIFTTGSTGFPKPAALTHRNVILNCITVELGLCNPLRQYPGELLLGVHNLPLSHVAGLCCILCTSLTVSNCTCVFIPVYRPDETLDCIQRFGCHILGQVPAMFNAEWNVEGYDEYDLSSLRVALYAGAPVTEPFLRKMASMSPACGTGLGMTETAGFATMKVRTDGDELLESLGFSSPFCHISIRGPKNEDGTVGEEMETGQVGEIVYTGPQVFPGYFRLPEKTAEEFATDEDGARYFYSGDVGYLNETGLHFAARRRLIMKPKGYQVFPGEVEDFIALAFTKEIEMVGTVGIHHKLHDQGIVAVIKLTQDFEDGNIDMDDIESEGESEEVMRGRVIEDRSGRIEELERKLRAKVKDIAAYKRPSLYLFMGEEEEFPLNRVRKCDYLACEEMAKEAVEQLRLEGGWDANVRDL